MAFVDRSVLLIDGMMLSNRINMIGFPLCIHLLLRFDTLFLSSVPASLSHTTASTNDSRRSYGSFPSVPLYSDAQIDGILHCLPDVICGTIVNIRSGYLIVPVYLFRDSDIFI